MNDSSSPCWRSADSAGSRRRRSASSPAGPISRPTPPTVPEHHRQARVGVRRVPAEHGVIDRGDRRRGEAQQEAVERAVVEPAPPRAARLFVGRCSRRRSRADGEASARRAARAAARTSVAWRDPIVRDANQNLRRPIAERRRRRTIPTAPNSVTITPCGTTA